MSDVAGVAWQKDTDVRHCDSCSLVLRDNSVHCLKEGLYFFYAHVTFMRYKEETGAKGQKRTVTLCGNARVGKSARKLFEGVYPSDSEGSVSVAKIVKLREGDSVSLNITTNYRYEIGSTYWGAYQFP
ncbi:lymphotoxin-alpha [Lampris incognitus]|uniref:lymphotoxin-alpha n=1 Tax=Lampris incognitus TaxID=2546036 RepID=UPI0024B4903F|nr:lymphotoxin-alpha [Lampris incognitus]